MGQAASQSIDNQEKSCPHYPHIERCVNLERGFGQMGISARISSRLPESFCHRRTPGQTPLHGKIPSTAMEGIFSTVGTPRKPHPLHSVAADARRRGLTNAL